VTNFILLPLLIITQVLGDIWLSRGMKSFGEMNPLDPSLWLPLLVYLLTNPWIWLGVLTLIVSLGLYLTAISRLDLSYVLPIHSFSYVLNTLFAWWLLNEHISAMRWMSTSLISLGVLLVGLSQGKTIFQEKKQSRKAKIISKNIPFFLFPLSLSLSKTWLAVIILSVADAAGDLFLALGMKQIGKVKRLPLKQMLYLIRQILTNPIILSGILCQAIAFATFISVLSWADISFVRPATALTYIISLLGAKFILKEKIARGRLIGIIFIGFGVLIHR
jgi:uncharacterized membrane protein